MNVSCIHFKHIKNSSVIFNIGSILLTYGQIITYCKNIIQYVQNTISQKYFIYYHNNTLLSINRFNNKKYCINKFKQNSNSRANI